jgi:tetratricopeptide (TPR) repeat protein
MLPWLGLVAVPLLVGGAVLWHRTHNSLAARLAQARDRLGTHSAGAELDQLARAYPGSAEVHFLGARQARLEGRLDEASARLDRAAALGWPAAQVERERLFLLAEVDFARARPDLEARLDAAPDDRDVLLALAGGEYRLGRIDRPIELTERALRGAPGDGEALCLSGRLWLKARRLDRARANLEAALAAGPDALFYRQARLSLALCLLDAGDFGRSLELFRACRQDEPDNAVALFGVGRAASFLGRWDEAEEAFEAVLAGRPGHLETLLALAQVREQRGDPAGALDCLERAERADPDRVETHYRLAKLLRVMGRDGEAAVHEARFKVDEARRLRRQAEPGRPVGLDERDLAAPSRGPGEKEEGR